MCVLEISCTPTNLLLFLLHPKLTIWISISSLPLEFPMWPKGNTEAVTQQEKNRAGTSSRSFPGILSSSRFLWANCILNIPFHSSHSSFPPLLLPLLLPNSVPVFPLPPPSLICSLLYLEVVTPCYRLNWVTSKLMLNSYHHLGPDPNTGDLMVWLFGDRVFMGVTQIQNEFIRVSLV